MMGLGSDTFPVLKELTDIPTDMLITQIRCRAASTLPKPKQESKSHFKKKGN